MINEAATTGAASRCQKGKRENINEYAKEYRREREPKASMIEDKDICP